MKRILLELPARDGICARRRAVYTCARPLVELKEHRPETPKLSRACLEATLNLS